MTISVLSVVDRNAPFGSRKCEGCRETGRELREVRVPYSGSGGYFRDLCGECIDRLRRMPRLPVMQHGSEKHKCDSAWDRALSTLRTPMRVGGQQAQAKGLQGEGRLLGPNPEKSPRISITGGVPG